MSAAPARPAPAPGQRRLAARLAAVQALYQLAMSDSTVDEVTAQFLSESLKEEVDGLSLAEADRKLFRRLVAGTARGAEDYDSMLAGVLPEDWPLERIETVLLMLLRAAIHELADAPETPARVVITQYMEVAHAFFGGKEPGFVNSLLDRLAHELRPEEFESKDPGAAP
jgi:N utilization substance protein B